MPNKLPYNPVKGVSDMYTPLFQDLLIDGLSFKVILIAVTSPDIQCLHGDVLVPDERIFKVYRTNTGSTLLLAQYPHLNKLIYNEVRTRLEVEKMFGNGPMATNLYKQLGWDGGNCPTRVPVFNNKDPRIKINKNYTALPGKTVL